MSRVVCLLLFFFVFNFQVQAQDGRAHGALISGQAGGGCSNNTGSTPPRYPGFQGGIPCTEYFKNIATFQGAPSSGPHFVGSRIGNTADRTFRDGLNVSYTEQISNSSYSYGLGNDNYSEFFQDGASRTRYLAFVVPNLVPALNINHNYENAYAYNKVVDGSSLGLDIEGGSLLLQVPKDTSKSFELLVSDPSGFTNFGNSNFNPFTVAWINPSLAYTPHSSIPMGIQFRSAFDSDAGKWRYYIDVDPRGLESIGKYVIYFYIQETTPRVVRYTSQVEGLIQLSIPREMYVTLTLSYGVDECVATAGVDIPTLVPALDTYQRIREMVGKDFKKQFKAVKGTPKGSAIRTVAKKLSRSLKKAALFETAARTADAALLSSQLPTMSETDQTRQLDDLALRARQIVNSGNTRTVVSAVQFTKNLSRIMPLLRGKSSAVGAQRPKLPSKYRTSIKELQQKAEEYLIAQTQVFVRLQEIRVNSAQCTRI